MKQKTARVWYIVLAALLLILTVVGLLTACDYAPIIDERCYDDYENFTFYEIEQEGVLGTMQSSYRLETPHGDIDIPDKVYEGAMEYEYLEICYEREDAVATTYMYTKKGNDLQPEPEIITETVIEYVTEYVTEIETVYTISQAFALDIQTPTVFNLTDNIVWVGYLLDEEDTSYTNEEEEVIVFENFQAGDLIVITMAYEPHTISDNLILTAAISHYRYGILVSQRVYTEDFQPIGNTSFEDYLLEAVPQITPRMMHRELYENEIE